jgi:uncharacterized protein (DUF2336 family)
VRRLCEEPVDVCAPLIVRSRALSDIDLIALIGRHGLPHARAIARRKDLNPTIAQLIKALERPTLVRVRQPEPIAKVAGDGAEPAAAAPSPPKLPGDAAETARRRLRTMMLAEGEATSVNPFAGSATYSKLRETALTGNAAFFQTALADALDIDFSTARSLTEHSSYVSLLAALRALDLSEDRAFLITVAVYPREFPHPQAIRIFLDRYRLLHHEAALEKLRGWKAETLSRSVRGNALAAANADQAPDGDKASLGASLKAS